MGGEERISPDSMATAVREASGRPGHDAMQWFGPVAIGALFVIFAWPTLRMLAAVYAHNGDYSHGFLVPLVCAYAAYRNRSRWNVARAGGRWPGAPLLILGIAGVLLGCWYEAALRPLGGLGTEFTCAVGLWTCVLGFFLAVAGSTRTRAFAFPIAYLVFAIPLPISFSDHLTLPLRGWVSAAAAGLIRGAGVAVFREGNILHLAGVSFGVDDACSGIRSLWVLAAGAVALAYLMRCGKARGLALLAAAIPAALCVNVLRVVVSALLAARFGLEFVSGWRHDACGWVTFSAGAAALVGLGWLLCRAKGKTEPVSDSRSHEADGKRTSPGAVRPAPHVFVAVAVLLGLGIAAYCVVQRHYAVKHVLAHEPTGGRKPLSRIPSRIGPFVQIGTGDLSTGENKALKPSDRVVRMYAEAGGQPVTVALLYWEPLTTRLVSRVPGPHSPDVCFPCSGWRRVEQPDSDLEPAAIPGERARIRLFRKPGREQVVLFWRRHLDLWSPDWRGRLSALLRSWRAPVRRFGRQYIVIIAAETTVSFETARDTAVRFARAIARILPEYGMGQATTPSAPNGARTGPEGTADGSGPGVPR